MNGRCNCENCRLLNESPVIYKPLVGEKITEGLAEWFRNQHDGGMTARQRAERALMRIDETINRLLEVREIVQAELDKEI
jgi:hypothetical protein